LASDTQSCGKHFGLHWLELNYSQWQEKILTWLGLTWFSQWKEKYFKVD
jgi:hypothetical protein